MKRIISSGYDTYAVLDSKDNVVKSFSDPDEARLYADRMRRTDAQEYKVVDKSNNIMYRAYMKLKTNKFNTNAKTDEKRNILEAIETAMVEKEKQWYNFVNRQFALTSGSGWSGEVIQCEEGYYIHMDGTRCEFTAFVQGDRVIRKPVHITPVQRYSIQGDDTVVNYISNPKPIKH